MIEKANEIIASASKKMKDATAHLEEELKTFRAGKANPSVFNSVMINYYGTDTPLPQAASITAPDAKTMIIQPWDKSLLKVMEKAIIDANLGFTPQSNGENIRINVPPLTEERRRDLVRQTKSAGETGKVTIRNIRRDAIEALKKLQKEGLPEDVEKDSETSVQKEVDAASRQMDSLLAAKEREIMTV